jgi:hypothetical protein
MSTNLRKLRIAFSAVCGIVCLFLVVLWVRSYWWRDYAYVRIISSATQDTYYDASSVQGGVTILAADYPIQPSHSRLRAGKTRPSASRWPTGLTPQFSAMGFAALRDGVRMRRYLTVPHWFLVSLIGSLAVGPWIRQLHWRFSLRTLLIATTLVAVVLGLAVAFQ